MHLFQSFCAKLPTSNDMDHGMVRHPDWYQDSLANSFFCHRNSCARNDVSNTLPKSGLISRIVTERWCCAVCHDLCSVNRIVCHRIGWGSRCDRRSESLCIYIYYIVELLLVYGRALAGMSKHFQCTFGTFCVWSWLEKQQCKTKGSKSQWVRLALMVLTVPSESRKQRKQR